MNGRAFANSRTAPPAETHRAGPRPWKTPFIPSLLPGLFLVLWVFTGHRSPAADKPADTNPPSPPRLVLALPPFVVTGVSNMIVLRGQRLAEMTALQEISGNGTNPIAFGTVTNVPVPERYKPERTGDQQVELRWVPPSLPSGGTNLFLEAVSPVGRSALLPLLTLQPGELLQGFRPSVGFADAPMLPPGKWVSGTLPDRRDVAVFRVEGRKGQRWRVQVWAWRLGSTLDSALTLHDARGAVLHRVDDSESRDPVLDRILPADGVYFVSLAGMDERSAPTHVYLLRADLVDTSTGIQKSER